MKKLQSVLTNKNNNKEKTTTLSLVKFFIIFFIVSLFICTILAAMSGGDSWKLQLFHNNEYSDMFMDFFNSLRDASAKNVYTARNNIYPPLSLLIFKFLGLFVSDDLLKLNNANRITLQYDERCMIVYFIFAILCILLMTSVINSYINDINKNKNKKTTISQTLISFLMIISYPVMYCMERGNIIILSIILTMFFVFFKDSENKVIREISYIALAIAAGIKLYPAIFGILLLVEKKYKDAVRLIIYGAIFVILPFVFFMDFDSNTLSIASNVLPAAITSSPTAYISESSSPIVNILENLISFATKKKNTLNFSSVSIQNFVFIFAKNNSTLAKILCAITELIAVAALMFARKKWMQIFLISYLMLNIPSASSSYSLAFLIIPFIMFLYNDDSYIDDNNNRQSTDWVYILCYALLLTPLPTFWYYYKTQAKEIFASIGLTYQTRFNQLIATLVFQFMFFVIVTEIFGKLLKTRKNSKTKSIEIATTTNNVDCNITELMQTEEKTECNQSTDGEESE